jgi:Raf kinase inhibitor-like YbhB/YbcL family protein
MNTPTPFRISSPSFQDGAEIPVQFTCDGKDINPALFATGIPAGTASLALVVEDPDAPSGNWVHWVVWNMKTDGAIGESSISGNEGINDFGKHHYGGPCPPSGTHRYYFRMYALDRMVSLPGAADRYQLAEAMKGHLLAETALMGTYTRVR